MFHTCFLAFSLSGCLPSTNCGPCERKLLTLHNVAQHNQFTQKMSVFLLVATTEPGLQRQPLITLSAPGTEPLSEGRGAARVGISVTLRSKTYSKVAAVESSKSECLIVCVRADFDRAVRTGKW